MVDLGLMGHLESELYIGAIALGGMIFNFLFWGFGFLRMGISGFTAQAFVSRNLKESMHVLIRSVVVAISGGILIFLPAYYLLKEPLGKNGLWLATMIWLAARGISLWLLSERAIYSKTSERDFRF